MGDTTGKVCLFSLWLYSPGSVLLLCVERCEKGGRGNCYERRKGRQQNGTSIYIGELQRMDLTIAVTPSLNAPPNGLDFPATGHYGFHPGGITSQRLSPKKAHPMGKKTNRHNISFHHKASLARATGETSRERRLAH